MYGWVWRHMFGPWPLKVIQSLILLGAVVALLFLVIFPWVEPRLPFTDVTVNNSPQPTAPQVPAQQPSDPFSSSG
ncbi:MAG: hypothetical protein WCL12_05185 [Actinomycetes bacterium]|jgi:hypothetical protein